MTRASLCALLLVSAACSAPDSSSRGGLPASLDTGSLMTEGTDYSSEPTAREISNYRLDMYRMQKYASAIKALTEASATDSSMLDVLSSGSANESTDELIARIQGTTEAMRILRANGLSARDYVWITAAYIQAAMTEGILAVNPEAKVAEDQNPQNVEFLRANRATLETMMRDAGMTQ